MNLGDYRACIFFFFLIEPFSPSSLIRRPAHLSRVHTSFSFNPESQQQLREREGGKKME
jgi:hypothetical protein